VIDIENEVFDTIAKALRTEYPSISVLGEYTQVPASFPVVTIEEKSNSVYGRTMDSSGNENHADVMYEVNVYSNSRYKKSECKAIFQVLDGEFNRLGFRRIMKQPIINAADTKVYRLVGRYTGIVSANKRVYRGY